MKGNMYAILCIHALHTQPIIEELQIAFLILNLFVIFKMYYNMLFASSSSELAENSTHSMYMRFVNV